jgi:hypothetical protein
MDLNIPPFVPDASRRALSVREASFVPNLRVSVVRDQLCSKYTVVGEKD